MAGNRQEIDGCFHSSSPTQISRPKLSRWLQRCATLGTWLTLGVCFRGVAAEVVTVRPKEIDEVLTNPGMGFTTFQRFNGDRLNEGLKWTEGFPIQYQAFSGSLTNQDHPETSIAYFRIYWKFVEPESGVYRWDLFDQALATAKSRGQSLMLRIAPYGTGADNDVPAWYRARVNGQELEKKLPIEKWRVHPENPLYLRHFGGLIRAFGARYDGHPNLELVDVSIVGAWGEGAGAERLTEATRRALLDCYLDTMGQTPLVLQLQDEKATRYSLSKRPVGWRVDCLGDMGGFSKTWSHMEDYYPQTLIQTGLQEAWRRAPVTMEVCWVMQHWKNQGWDIDHIIDESLKWHISSFNAKSSAVPIEWWPQVNRWLKRMGYRFVLRKFTYPAVVRPREKLAFTSWWENKGVAPCYKQFPLGLRLKSRSHSEVLVTGADITQWLPGDNLFDGAVTVPAELPAGEYDLALALIDPDSKQPKVKLAIEGRDEDGWYRLGKIRLQETRTVQAGPPVTPLSPPGTLYNISLVTENAPDLTDIDTYLRSITSQYRTPQEQAIAVWRWSQRLRKQTTNPMEDGHYVLDPIQMFNSYGYCNCGIVSGLNDALWLRLGWKARYVQLGDHTVSECSWDGGRTWHMFDSSMSFYCFNDRGEVASVREIEQNPRFYLENFAPECGTNPVDGPDDHRGWRCASDRPVEYQRTLANGFDSFKPPNDLQEGNLYAQWGRRYVLNLRPQEYYTLYFHPLEDGGPRHFRPVRGTQDPDTAKAFRSNGVWRYAPDLRDPATREFVYSESNISWTKEGLRPIGPDGVVVFKVSAANVVTSAQLDCRAVGATISVSRDAGRNWEALSATTGSIECREPIAGVTEYLVKIRLGGPGAILSSIAIETRTQLNRPALPKLVRGANRVQARLGRQVETIQWQPSIMGGQHRQSILAEKAIDVEPQPNFYKPTLRPGEQGIPCFVTWKIEAPTPITDLIFGGNVCVKSAKDRVALLHSWDDQEYFRDFQKSDDTSPADLMVNAAVTSVPPGTHHAYLRYEFQTDRFPKHYFGPGIQSATMTLHHQPRRTGFTPMEVTYCWIEHRESGDLERRHTELVTSPAHEYQIRVGGFRDPTMRWVRVNLQGSGPDGMAAKTGYSDGQDAEPGAKPERSLYRWGKNLALGKPYTLDGKQNGRNPDARRDLTDGLIAPPDTYVSEKYMPTYVMFDQDVSPVVTIDLGSAPNVSAVRIHAGQEGKFHISYPDQITVETSIDGAIFVPAGSAEFRQVFDPPADYVPWELDEALTFADLPASGRLAYAYRIILEKPTSARFVRVQCRGRKGWGMLLSEVQVFDTVSVDKDVPPLVFLPPIRN